MSVRAAALLTLAAVPDDGLFLADVPEPLCVGPPDRQFLFGGIALAAAIEAMERRTGRPAIFASAQFLTQARPSDPLRLEAGIVADGRLVRQCGVTAWQQGAPFLHVHGACGGRDDAVEYRGAAMPVVPPPDACAGRSVARRLSSNLNALLEFRLASGAIPDRADWEGSGGTGLACWIRARCGAPLDHLLLAVIADCAALALDGALGRPTSGSSLDNVIRFLAEPAGEWVLAAMKVDGIHQGIAHVTTQLFSEQGVPLAVATQTMRLRTG
jgi:acyl-CoA thioesterase